MKSSIIGIVGPCGAGKSTLINLLKKHGFQARHIAQEHSGVSDMWQQISKPDILIYLDVSYPLNIERSNLNLSEAEFEDQRRRLRHAREHADLYLNTDNLTPEEVLKRVLDFLQAAIP